MTAQPRRHLVSTVVVQKRREHPELRGRVTLAGVRAVLAHERIRLMEVDYHQTSVLGCSIHFGGVAVIQLHSALKRDAALYVLLHELGHMWLQAR